MVSSSALLLVLAVSSVICQKVEVNHVEGSTPLNLNIDGQVLGKVHATQVLSTKPITSRVLETNSIGAGLEYQRDNGVIAGADVTHQLGGGTRLDLNANVPLHRGADGQLDANVHGSRMSGGPFNRAESVGGGLQYQHNSGAFANVDVTHHRGIGDSYSANVGRNIELGPRTLSVGVGAAKNPWSSGVDKQVGFTYRAKW